MFENIIAQDAVSQLASDLRSQRLAPSMLFFGPSASGKGSAALELARVLSCSEGGGWNCNCSSCARHRYLLHGDLLMLGPRPFSAEIAAARSAWQRDTALPATRALFIRSLRKLQGRFSPVLLEDDPQEQKKLSPLLQSLEEGLEEFERLSSDPDADCSDEKISETLLRDALKLEGEGIGKDISINLIRRASYWSRLAPNGRRKLLLIENADRMKDEARNSLLKLLEEPPPTVSIVLVSRRRESIIAPILSRLRPYHFLKREAEKEREVIRRVFRDSEFAEGSLANGNSAGDGSGLVSAYLDSFLPQGAEKLNQGAAYFIVSVARAAASTLKKKGIADMPDYLSVLGSRYAPTAEYAGFDRSFHAKDVIKNLLAASGNFEGGSSSRFLAAILDLVSAAGRGASTAAVGGPGFTICSDIWRKYAAEAEAAMNVYNQTPALALEAFFYRLKEALADG